MDAPLPACHGLIAAWDFRPGQPPRTISAAEVPAAIAEGGAWLHFDLIDMRARTFLQALDLPVAVRRALVDPDEATRIDVAGDVVHGCIPDTHYDAAGSDRPVGMLHFALTPGLLLTARRHPLRGVHAALQALEAESPATALAAVLRETVQEFGRHLAGEAARLAKVEDAMLAGRNDRAADATLAGLQREALRLSRTLDPLAEALDELDTDQPDWLAATDPLARERRRVRHAVRSLAALREGARIAQDQAAARATSETNRRLLVLSVISAAMLPASLVAGIFGMNVGGVPGVPLEGADAAWGFGMAMALIAGSVLGVLAALRAFRML
jgi:zinc transporter